jgi:hypothetical protein
VSAAVELKNSQILTRNYGPNLVIQQEPINAEYQPAVIRGEEAPKIFVQEATLRFLKVICGESNSNLNVFRVLIRNIITGRFEGRNWQSAVYLYGAPGTAKSVWADLIKRIVPAGAVQELNRHQNQFSIGQLDGCQILIVSDLTQITQKQVEVLKRVLGRDTLTHERKYESEFGVISPTCQVLIISNKKPADFYLFGQDQAIMDKLIKVYLGPEFQITSQFQIPNIATRLDRYISDIFNWAMYCPPHVLQFFIRAVMLNQLHEKEVGAQVTGPPAFVEQCCFEDPRAFTFPTD